MEVRTAAGTRWEVQALGDLPHAPAAQGGRLAVVDEAGTVYGYEIGTGAELWRRNLGSGPVQPVLAAGLGYVVATREGVAWALDPASGAARRLGMATEGPLRVLPFGEGALLLGGGRDGFRVVGADGSVRPFGDAMPSPQSDPWTGPDGVAWVEAQTVRFASSKSKEPTPVAVPALGSDVKWLTGADGVLYGLDAAGTLRAVSIDAPDRLLWSVSVGGTPSDRPLVLGDGLFILADGGVVAVER
jgi:hypothetical protein